MRSCSRSRSALLHVKQSSCRRFEQALKKPFWTTLDNSLVHVLLRGLQQGTVTKTSAKSAAIAFAREIDTMSPVVSLGEVVGGLTSLTCLEDLTIQTGKSRLGLSCLPA
ncbi:hypothetical protein WJX81_007010 [Elliptochloris bilobata]|uniref:Uncharacterized protein n=1 Tax=Elliptochloris bilobata TaxID=381761 RepID=A0AAW1RHW5_9CHLO